MELEDGIHDLVIDQTVDSALSTLANQIVEQAQLDPGDSHDFLAAHLSKIISRVFSSFSLDTRLERQRALYNQIVRLVSEIEPELSGRLLKRAAKLLEIRPVGQRPYERADTPLSMSCILTRTRTDPTLESQLRKELDSADHADIICSFILWSGIRLLKTSLDALTQSPDKKLRVLTTSYMGATEPKAIDYLHSLTHTEIKVSYDHQRTRLHAKAFIFHRKSGFGTAYIGSSNISNAAMTEGLEWNVKISQRESPHQWAKLTASFDTLWESEDEFELYTEGSRERLVEALRDETSNAHPHALQPFFDLRPYPFQQEILDRISAERLISGRRNHLVVAATGTGKTMIAAFDYKGYCATFPGRRPTLLFVAHRIEILDQSLRTFQAVLRDRNFGELYVGGRRPVDSSYVFMSIQSFSELDDGARMPADYYDYIVVDEFHHAAAGTYVELLRYFKPKCLIGLTATPERADGLPILDLFDGHITAEIRLPDAINRKLLCPFQYFGISDSVNLEGIRWARGGYDKSQLEDVYVINEYQARQRVELIVSKLYELLLDYTKAKAIGFCVSVAHAQFMEREFNERGLRAISISSATPATVRDNARQMLVRGEINYIFTVDIFNEGVDVPEIDTVLFLRPTESLTVFLQQLGRGLRLCDGKPCLTVMDFIGQANRNYRFDVRYRALMDDPSRSVSEQVEQGFPHLPAGCSVQLERMAQSTVLDAIRRGFTTSKAGLASALREIYERTGEIPSLQLFLQSLSIVPDDIYRRGVSYSELCAHAGIRAAFSEPDTQRLTLGLRRIQHINGIENIRFLRRYFSDLNGTESKVLRPVESRWLAMAFSSLLGNACLMANPSENVARLKANPTLRMELVELLRYQEDEVGVVSPKIELPFLSALECHAEYTRDEVLIGLGHWTYGKTPDLREGVLRIKDLNTDIFLFTLNKTEKDYSPTTMYDDYAISDSLFHWQSQSGISSNTSTGSRYINHQRLGCTILLFVRENARTNFLSNPFFYLGPADFVSYSGNKPMSIIWRLQQRMPAKLARMSERLAVA